MDKVVGIFITMKNTNIAQEIEGLLQSCENDIRMTSKNNRDFIDGKSLMSNISNIDLTKDVCIVFDNENDYERIINKLNEIVRITITCKITKIDQKSQEYNYGKENTYHR